MTTLGSGKAELDLGLRIGSGIQMHSGIGFGVWDFDLESTSAGVRLGCLESDQELRNLLYSARLGDRLIWNRDMSSGLNICADLGCRKGERLLEFGIGECGARILIQSTAM